MSVFCPSNVPILFVDVAIEMKMSFISKPNFYHIEGGGVDSAHYIIVKLQSLFHRHLTQWMVRLDFERKEFDFVDDNFPQAFSFNADF
ncbi:hypothetical protein NPIL_689491 [Nephila pilipes]|uniref:Uncharacterized protein n=1 Tax=Nephila pilipes TaxID=299642 RepID=A0A8X6ITI4_NEPPI|nr:hypothetical protein NPIL_689491 [Nephila pilipes]